ncbi:MAG: hypothetical protein K6D92_04445 [Erysipelotrichaceae bacterium]|nr:hypothetical protein [Erysipelotrichaceae bacterium]
MTVKNETKKNLFARINQVKAEALEETEAFSNKRNEEQKTIEELGNEIEILKAQFEEASSGDNDDQALSLLSKQKQKEIELEMRQKKQISLEDRTRREAVFKAAAAKIVEAKEELHNYAVDDIARIATELFAALEEYSGKEEELRNQLEDMAFNCNVISCKAHKEAYIHCNYTVKRSVLGQELFKAVKQWTDAFNEDPNSLFTKINL